MLRLSRLTADLRKIADVEGADVDRRPVDVAALLEEAIEIAREQPAAATPLSLDLPRAPWPLPAVRGDAELLSLALLNLVDNAMKYTPRRATGSRSGPASRAARWWSRSPTPGRDRAGRPRAHLGGALPQPRRPQRSRQRARPRPGPRRRRAARGRGRRRRPGWAAARSCGCSCPSPGPEGQRRAAASSVRRRPSPPRRRSGRSARAGTPRRRSTAAGTPSSGSAG